MTQERKRPVPDAGPTQEEDTPASSETARTDALKSQDKSLTKKERLAQELRRNLARRKAQARARAATDDNGSPPPDATGGANTNC